MAKKISNFGENKLFQIKVMELSKSKASLISSLSSKKMRKKNGLFVVEGEKSVSDILGSFTAEYLVCTPEWIEINGKKYKDKKDLQIYSAPFNTIKKISSLSTPSEVMGVFRMPEHTLPKIESSKLYVLLDGVQDPGNLGTIIRTADWFGVDTIFASLSTADVYNPKTVQATMGSLCRVKICYTDLIKLIEENREMPTYGTFLDGRNIYNSELDNRGFIIMGNEGNGISDSLGSMIENRLLIPPYDAASHGESLNVAIATAIVLSKFRFG